MQMRQ